MIGFSSLDYCDLRESGHDIYACSPFAQPLENPKEDHTFCKEKGSHRIELACL
jgi:hypothetical protein